MSSNDTNDEIHYSPKKAWVRASVYFAVCLTVSWYFRVLQDLWQQPIALASQLADPLWWLATILVSAYVVFAYVYYWPKGTVTHGRSLRPFAVLLFGFLWGFAQGQLVLVIYDLIEGLGLSAVWNVVIMFGVISNLTAVWHSRYWDIYVSPDHNVYEWNLRKVLVAHTPYLLLSVTHLAIFGNAALFVAWQVLALTASAFAMRFPAPNDADAPAHDGKGVRVRMTQ